MGAAAELPEVAGLAVEVVHRAVAGGASFLEHGRHYTELAGEVTWERSVADVVASDSDVSSYVARLESRYDEADATGFLEDDEDEDDDDWFDEDDLPTGDTLAEDFERYLRDQGDE